MDVFRTCAIPLRESITGVASIYLRGIQDRTRGVLRGTCGFSGKRGLVERRVAVIGVLCEDVVESHGLQVAALDEVDQLRVAVGDGGQVGVDEDDLLRLKRLPGVSDEAGFVLRD
jgi:hypothetical protein